MVTLSMLSNILSRFLIKTCFFDLISLNIFSMILSMTLNSFLELSGSFKFTFSLNPFVFFFISITSYVNSGKCLADLLLAIFISL
jgi:hypothetical protein